MAPREIKFSLSDFQRHLADEGGAGRQFAALMLAQRLLELAKRPGFTFGDVLKTIGDEPLTPYLVAYLIAPDHEEEFKRIESAIRSRTSARAKAAAGKPRTAQAWGKKKLLAFRKGFIRKYKVERGWKTAAVQAAAEDGQRISIQTINRRVQDALKLERKLTVIKDKARKTSIASSGRRR